jgi:hypothetical protein
MVYKDLLNQAITVTVNAQKKYSGVVRKVGNDYLLLEDDTVGTIIVPWEHVKQFTMGSFSQSTSSSSKNRVNFGPLAIEAVPDELVDVLKAMKDTVVHLEGAGSNPTIGYVLSVKDDYLVTSVIPDGSVYFPIRHVQMILPLEVTVRAEFLEWLLPRRESISNAECFHDVLQQAAGELIKLGRGGPADISGILRAVHEEFIEIVVSPHVVAAIPTHHVKAFSRLEQNGYPLTDATPTHVTL